MEQSMSAMQKALVEAGMAEAPKPRKRRLKQFNCKKCGAPMIRVEGTNTMACSSKKCNNFYVFDKAIVDQKLGNA